MKSATVVLFILVAIMAVMSAPAKESKLVRIPFRKVVRKRSMPRRSMAFHRNATSELSPRGTSTLYLTSYKEVVWLGTISIGTPRQFFKLIMDTGGGTTWVADLTCGDCGALDKYDGGASSTFVDLGRPFSAIYGPGISASGTWTGERFALGYHSDVFVNQAFGRASEVPPQAIEENASGLLALGFRARLPEQDRDLPTLIENLRSQQVIDKNVISCHFIKDDDVDAGEIIFGGVDNSLVSGEILYTPIIFNQGLPDWIIPFADIRIPGGSLGQSDIAYFDTGCGDIFISDVAAQSLYSAVPGAELKEDGWVAPSPFPFDVQFVVGTRAFTIPAADLLTPYKDGDKYVCAIQGGSNNLWIIGDIFIKNHYVVFDFDANAIGIGDRNDL